MIAPIAWPMKADPQVGKPSYSQGFVPNPYYWYDRARAVEIGASTTVAAGSFDDVLITEEFDESDPTSVQLKYYARDVGNVRIGWTGTDPLQETMELVEIVTLDEAGIAEVRQQAMELEFRGNLYGTAGPATPRN